jgi:hypothetical protein
MLISFCNLFHSLFLPYSKLSPINTSAGLGGLGPMFFEVHNFVRLAAIHKVLGESAGNRVAVVHNMGGMGKTQLATAYAKRRQKDFLAVAW